MSDVIQPLLDRIHTEGLKKAEAERDSLLAEAKEKAAQLLSDAEHQAAEIRSTAEKDAEASIKRGTTALEQAARDVLLRLRTEIARQVTRAGEAAASKTLSSEEVVKDLILRLVQSETATGTIQVEANAGLAESLKAALPALLQDTDGVEVILNPKIQSGFQLRYGDTAAGVDLTDAAVAEWISTHLRKDLADLLAPAVTSEG